MGRGFARFPNYSKEITYEQLVVLDGQENFLKASGAWKGCF